MTGVYCCSSAWPACWTDKGLSVQFPSGWCVSQSCQWQLYIHHAFPVCLCSSLAAPQECPAVPDHFPICLMERLLISSGQAWPCNQPSSLLPLFHSTSPVWSHFRGTAPTLLGIIWSSFLAWVQIFLGCLKMVWLPSYPKLFTYITVFFHSTFACCPFYTICQWIEPTFLQLS